MLVVFRNGHFLSSEDEDEMADAEKEFARFNVFAVLSILCRTIHLSRMVRGPGFVSF